MRRRRTRLGWVTVSLAVLALAAACGGSATPTPGPTSTAQPEPTATTLPSPTPLPAATLTQVPPAADPQETARQEYAATVRAIQERSKARREAIFEPVERAGPGPTGLRALAEALPRAIEQIQSDIAKFEVLVVPEDFLADHQRAISFFRDQIEQWRRELEAAKARDELKLRELGVEGQMLALNMLSDLSKSFREFFLTSEESRKLGQLFGGLSDEESAYLIAVRAIQERSEARGEAIFEPVERAGPGPTGLRALAEALPRAIEQIQSDIAEFEVLVVPEDFLADHQQAISFFRDQIEQWRRELEAAKAGDELKLTRAGG